MKDENTMMNLFLPVCNCFEEGVIKLADSISFDDKGGLCIGTLCYAKKSGK